MSQPVTGKRSPERHETDDLPNKIAKTDARSSLARLQTTMGIRILSFPHPQKLLIDLRLTNLVKQLLLRLPQHLLTRFLRQIYRFPL